jgi:S1-C subfamily serine protease
MKWSKFMLRNIRWMWILVLLAVPAIACGSFTPQAEAPVQPVAQPVITQIVMPTPALTSDYQPLTSEESVLIELYERANPAVVNLTVYADTDNFGVQPLSQGSGFVYDLDGNIVTNAHVVHAAEEIEVNFFDGRTLAAELVGEDLNSDLAVVRVSELPAGIIPLTLGDMDNLAVGQTVVAIGNPFGMEGTLTRGIISALGRTIPGLTIFSIPQTIQTDAAINPGNSGGPLLNLRGEVIGVNAQIRTDGDDISNSGVGFAIPVSIISRVVPALVQDGEYTWPWLGVSGGDISLQLVEAMDLSDDRGAYIATVIEDGPAEKAGLRGANDSATLNGRDLLVGGDIITAIDGLPVTSFDDLLVYVALQTSPGQEVMLSVLRDGETLEIPLELEPRPAN